MPNLEVNPAPTEMEAAAIAAAVEALWPRPMGGVSVEQPHTVAWRFSGRWWQRDRYTTAERPWA